jgi:hypothetical protein
MNRLKLLAIFDDVSFTSMRVLEDGGVAENVGAEDWRGTFQNRRSCRNSLAAIVRRTAI